MDPATALNDLNRPQPSTTDQSQTPKQPYRRARHPYQEAASPSCHCALSEKAPRRAGIEEENATKRRGSCSSQRPSPPWPPGKSSSAPLPLRLSHHRASHREVRVACEHKKTREQQLRNVQETRAHDCPCSRAVPRSTHRRKGITGTRPLVPHLGALGQGRRRQPTAVRLRSLDTPHRGAYDRRQRVRQDQDVQTLGRLDPRGVHHEPDARDRC